MRGFMKTFKMLPFLFLSLPAFAQFTVAPFGSSASSIPVGESVSNHCLEDCEFEIIIKPFCFGTNLRAYPAKLQMDPKERITANIVFKDKTKTKQDTFNISFPGNMTFATEGTLVDCVISQNEARKGPGESRDISCPIPSKNNEIQTFNLKGWKSTQNPNIRFRNDFTNYAGIGLQAKLSGPPVDGVDNEITCLYKFTKNKDGAVINSSVACYFPSTLPDLSGEITIIKDGIDPTPPENFEISAYTNFIKVKLKKSLNSISNKVVVKNGALVLPPPPEHSIEFTQRGRRLFDSYEKKGFDENNGFQSFTTQVKFAGSQGFCGGYYSPLMLFFDEKLPRFSGVSSFPLYGLAPYTPVHWPEPKAPGYFLVHLKNRKTPVTSHEQLFGQDDKFDNGFEALKVHDDNMDGKIDKKDKIFTSLYLWSDLNGNGHSEKTEIRPLSDKKVVGISLKYTTNDPTNFQNRARVREKGSFEFLKAGKVTKAKIYDVWLSPLEQ